MSRIITKWKCEECGQEFDYYVSFGYPNEDFDFEWECSECGHINILHIEALSMGHHIGWLFDNKGEENA